MIICTPWSRCRNSNEADSPCTSALRTSAFRSGSKLQIVDPLPLTECDATEDAIGDVDRGRVVVEFSLDISHLETRAAQSQNRSTFSIFGSLSRVTCWPFSVTV